MYIYIHIYRFELADVPPPPRNEKVGSQVNVTFLFWQMYPPPRNEEVGSQVNVTFQFWQMYPPPRMEISEISD